LCYRVNVLFIEGNQEYMKKKMVRKQKPKVRAGRKKTAMSPTLFDNKNGTPDQLDVKTLECWLWEAACGIRGAVDAPKFKDYILPLIFVKRLSDVFEDEVKRVAEKFGDEKTARDLIGDDHSLVRFYIPPRSEWAEIRKITSKVGEKLTEALRAISKQNPSLQGVIDIVDFNATISGERIVDDGKLQTLIEIISKQRLGLKDCEPDILGRAYDYLLRKFAEGQGQSAGEFLTPKEVGWLMAYILDPQEGQSIYDPACGTAGLLIKCELALQEKMDGKKVKKPLQMFGQEQNSTTFAMARMNMVIHDMEGEIAIGDTMRNPKHLDGSMIKTFDLVTANPMWNQDGYDSEFYENDTFERFKRGYPTANSADWGWVQLMEASLNDKGRMAVVLDTGAVSRGSGSQGSNKEKDIRKAFVDSDLIDAVLLLPDNLFYNTTAAGIIMLLSKNKPKDRKGKILLINASKEFEKGRPKNFLPEERINRVAKAYHDFKSVDHFTKVITIGEAVKNDYNLSPSRYVETGAAEEYRDISVLLEELSVLERESSKIDDDLKGVFSKLGFQVGEQ
jgi:type I restriction enzyme M protein